jgi:hypothetical protein
VSIMHDRKSYTRRLSKLEKEGGTTIVSNQYGFICIIVLISRFGGEGYLHAVLFADYQTGYRWLYGMKTKDETIDIVKQWYNDIAKHKLVVFTSDNAGENKS